DMAKLASIMRPALGRKLAKDVLPQRHRDGHVAHRGPDGVVETILRTGSGGAVGTLFEVTVECVSIGRLQLAGVGPGEVEQEAGGFTIHRSPSEDADRTR